MKRLYRVTALGTSWDCLSLLAALTLIASLKLDYGTSLRVTLVSCVLYRVVEDNPQVVQLGWAFSESGLLK